MSTSEFHSFVQKFYHLWNSGRSAHLGLRCHVGEAWVGLRAQLGGPPQYHGFHHQPTPKRVSPSRDRRRARRVAARSERTEENDIIEKNTTEKVVAEKNSTEAVEASNTVEETNLVIEAKEAKRVNVTENAPENSNELKKFACEICDFSSKWENGLVIHMTKKHGNIEQLDGIMDIETDDNKYDRTRYYWESGTIGIAYCNYIDVIDIIENSDLKPTEKEIEKNKVTESRKEFFGSKYKNYPPWK